MLPTIAELFIIHRPARSWLLFIGSSLVALLLLLSSSYVLQAQIDTNSAPHAPGRITGRVVGMDGIALSGVDVVLTNNSYLYRLQTLSADDGTFGFELLPAGIYRLSFGFEDSRVLGEYYNGASSSTEAAEIIVTGNEVDIGTVELTPGGAISGRIEAANGISITLRSVQARKCTTEERLIWLCDAVVRSDSLSTQGEYTLTNLLPGDYIVCVSADVIGKYTVLVRECWPDKVNLDDALTELEIVTITGGEHVQNIDLLMGESTGYSQVSGTVRDVDGLPLVGIHVEQPRRSPRAAVTDATGTYSLPIMYPWVGMQIAFDDPQKSTYLPETITVTVDLGQTISGIDAVLRVGGRLQGSLTMMDGIVFDSANVFARQLDETGSANQDNQDVYSSEVMTTTGAFDISALPDGLYELSSYATVGERSVKGIYGNITIENASVVSGIEFGMADNLFDGKINGRVTDLDGAPLSNIRVSVYDRFYTFSNPQVYVETDAEGRYQIEGLPNDEYGIGFSDPSQQYATIYHADALSIESADVITVSQANLAHEVNAVLSAGGTISGVVQDEEENALNDIQVYLYGLNRGDTWVPIATPRTDENGRYQVSALPPNRYRVCFLDRQTGESITRCIGSGLGFEYAQDIRVTGGETTVRNLAFTSLHPQLYIPLFTAHSNPSR